MANLYKHFYSLFTEEKAKLDRFITKRQDAPQPALQTPLAVGAALLGLGVSSLLLGTTQPKEKLEDHPMCGITTGGQAECYFDCEVFAAENAATSGQIITNLECLKDCFGNQIGVQRQKPESCLSSLISDVLVNGICNLTDFSSPECDQETFEGCPPIFEDIYDINESCTFDFGSIDNGTCSMETEELLVGEECIKEVFSQPGFIQNTLLQLIYNSCNFNVSESYINIQQQISGFGRNLFNFENYDIQLGSEKITQRLAPAQQVLELDNFTINTQLDYENTRHRYPWVCSLRSTGAAPEHLCAVTLLSIPPKPTVVVGAAHCTYICKNDNKKAIPVCCCGDDVESCADDKNKCGDNPEVFEMTGDDVEILCGEWETGDTPMVLSGEKYNVLLPIKEILRHPNFNATEGAGPIGGSDIAIFKVDDSSIQKKASSLRLNPICLPTKQKQKEGKQTGIHTGWSKPPPFHFVEEQATGYLRLYRDFFKQWHYKMDIETCRDPLLNGVFGGILENPSNSFYPPATVCAKDFSRQSCFSTGDSGSPLMLAEKTRPMRFYAEGILSFVKGCDVFTFGPTNDERTSWQLNQQSENPSTYTKLSCFLPWVAQQYGLEYKTSDETDPACIKSQGDPLDGENTCTITPSNLIDFFVGEVECILPFYYGGNKYEQCVLFDESGFVYPIFRCPTKNSTEKIDGINSYPTIALTEGLCPDNVTSDLNPNIQDCDPLERRAPFSQCKNNCPGVRAFGIIGGGAALAFLGALSGIQLLAPAAAGLGAVGVAGFGGNAVAEMMCVTPYCRDRAGECCLIQPTPNNFLACPDICPV